MLYLVLHINTNNATDTVDMVYIKCIIDITMYIRFCTSHVEVVNKIYCLTVLLSYGKELYIRIMRVSKFP